MRKFLSNGKTGTPPFRMATGFWLGLKLLSFPLLFLPATAHAQPGCTDPQATNFDPAATENDGSCLYAPTSFQPPIIGTLPEDLEECSGLAFFGGSLWTHLDGGNPDQLFTLDTLTAEKLQTITVPNSDNHDWEDLAEDDEHLYIGDFGNNDGDRTDLRIYKIKKADLLAGAVSPELIEFSFSDQTDFTPMHNENNFDCEAFFFWQDSLHLFSKNWVDFKTRHYVLPASPGTHVAELRDSLNVQGQITAADITEDGKVLLLGYNVSTIEAFIYLLFDFHGSDFFSGNKRRISMGQANLTSQTEGLVFRDMRRGYICSESLSVFPQRLLSFDIEEWVDNPVSAESTVGPGSGKLSVFPNPAGDFIHLKMEGFPNGDDLVLHIYGAKGEIVFSKKIDKTLMVNELEINTAHLRSGNYWVQIAGGEINSGACFSKK